MYAMGNNMHGRLGLGDKRLSHSAVPCLLESLLSHHVTKISCGSTHTAAVTGTRTCHGVRVCIDQGAAFTWGLGEAGALGHGDTVTQYTPIQVQHLVGMRVKATLVSCGNRHTAFVGCIS